MFGAIAHRYDLNNRVHSLGRDHAWRRRAVRLAGVSSGDRVLDVACGTGDLAEAFAGAGPAAVTGVDFAEPMLEIARRKASARRRAPGVPMPDYRSGDALALPFASGSFDVVSIAFGIRNVADADRALRELRRVLRPGGRLVVLEFSEPRVPILRALARFYTHRIMPWTASWLARDRSGAYRYLPRSIDTFLDRDALAARIEAAGFGAVRQEEMTFGICVAYAARRAG
jgi:demethylmenaquinone methyltransferase/2-methoxy-6-polyprenyl-1,4-benzoquinol methylase